MLGHFYMKYQCRLKLLAHVPVPHNADVWWLEITQMMHTVVMKQKVCFKKIKGAYLPEDEAMFLYDADVELKGHL